MKVMFQDGVPVAVLIIELLLILSINNGSRTAADKWDLLAAVYQHGPKTASDGILEPLLMTFSVIVSPFIIVTVFLIYYTHTLHHHLSSCLSQSNHILQTARTRNNNAENIDIENLPPPTLEQVPMIQAQMLHTMH
jgi:hypothetical protein